MNSKPFFISLEGTEGSGKTTVGQMLKEKLRQENYDVILTREPGGVKISEKIREIILDKENSEMDKWTEALLYIAARRQHTVEVILPALQDNKIVICDRFIDSTSAYQGLGRGLGIINLNDIQNTIIGNARPDLTIFFDLEPEIGLKRIKDFRMVSELNRLDLEQLDFHQKVYEGYRILLSQNPQRIKVINAKPDIKIVFKQVWVLVQKYLLALNMNVN
ncbi:dTMP kinase [Spiroplasma endosymbiont of Agriotes lineatus]|uniref:dTMP kinase n=1 Tax=Spiroplasma endosymbiont of Agriotes lineatus TaxID=3077930 RepID=UPI0030CEE829